MFTPHMFLKLVVDSLNVSLQAEFTFINLETSSTLGLIILPHDDLSSLSTKHELMLKSSTQVRNWQLVI